jgi:outer membrane receptor for ferrienterochelin and colicin
MRNLRFTALIVAVVLFAGAAFAQGVPQSTLTGRVLNEGQGLPGVTVTVKSPNLQGTRTAVTSVNGDFILPLLPPGEYNVTFTMSGFQTVTRQVKLSAAQSTPVQISMGISSIAAEAVVVAQRETISQTQQNATTVTSESLGKLPTARNLAAAVALAPGTSNTGPSGNTVISGAMSFENLYLVNGVAVQDNIRNTPYNLFIEDAIQEQTVTTSGISAEYGRFTGGVVNVITKSGGNVFSGSFRTNFENDKWTKKTDYVSPTTGLNTERKVDKIVPTYELTLGGPILKDRLWFFLAGRSRKNEASANTAAPLTLPYVATTDEQRYEAKLTFSLGARHTLLANYQQIDNEQLNNSFGTIMDLRSLYDRKLPQSLFSVNYSGTLSDNFFVEGQYSTREFTFEGSGSRFTDKIFGTLMVNNANGRRWWSPTFCGVCEDEKRDADQALLKGTYFLSTKSLGSHSIVLGGEMYDDQRFSNNHQSGSDYRIYVTNVLASGGEIYPVVNTTASGNSLSFIRWTPILEGSQGNSFKTWSVFLNDVWSLNKNFSFNVGLRWDKNDGQDGTGRKTVDSDAISPRLGGTWDVKGDGDMIVSAAYARYVAGINNSQGDASSVGGQPATVDFDYRGPTFNLDPNGPLTPTEEVVRQVFAWFEANGGTSRPVRGIPSIPGINPNIEGTLYSPNTDEFSLGLKKNLGSRGMVRGDIVYRTWNDFYGLRVDMGTGTVSGTLAGVTRTFNKQLVINTDEEERKYWGFTLSAAYRPIEGLQLQGNWTWSRLRGTFDGENAASGALQSAAPYYAEYKDASWNRPAGDLGADQRHKIRLWAIYDLPLGIDWVQTSVSLLQNFDSGLPYGAVGAVDTRPYVTNPGYLSVPSSHTYYFTARDAFRTDDVWRTDLSLNLSFRPFGSVEVFASPQVLNVFNQQAQTGVTTTIETAQNTTGYTAFNPFTTAPVQGARNTGANWNYSAAFGSPISPASYQLPRTFRFSVGIRF